MTILNRKLQQVVPLTPEIRAELLDRFKRELDRATAYAHHVYKPGITDGGNPYLGEDRTPDHERTYIAFRLDAPSGALKVVQIGA